MQRTGKHYYVMKTQLLSENVVSTKQFWFHLQSVLQGKVANDLNQQQTVYLCKSADTSKTLLHCLYDINT